MDTESNMSIFEEELEMVFAKTVKKTPEEKRKDEINAWFSKSSQKNMDFKKWFYSLPSETNTSNFFSQRNKQYFTDHAGEYPLLKRISDLVNTIPGSSGSIERLFSIANDMMSAKRNSLNTSTAYQLLQVGSYYSIKSFFE